MLDTSKLAPGEEQHEYYDSATLRGKRLMQYDYRAFNGRLFSTVATSLAQARAKRDAWIRLTEISLK